VKLETNTLIFLVALLAASVLVLLFAPEQHVDAWMAVIIAVLTGGGGALLPQLLHKKNEPAPRRARDSKVGPTGPDQR